MLTPFRGFWDTQSEFDRMFDEVVRDALGRRRRGTNGVGARSPRLAALARDGDLVLRYDLPGVGLDEVDITLDGSALTISGERRPADDSAEYYLNELPYGAFTRTVTVPEGVDADAITARFEGGVLEVVLPGAVREVEPKRIAIEGDAS